MVVKSRFEKSGYSDLLVRILLHASEKSINLVQPNIILWPPQELQGQLIYLFWLLDPEKMPCVRYKFSP